MSEHTESPLPKARPKSAQLQQLEAALAAAKNHRLVIPPANLQAIRIQDQIIAQWEQRIASLTGGSWLK